LLSLRSKPLREFARLQFNQAPDAGGSARKPGLAAEDFCPTVSLRSKPLREFSRLQFNQAPDAGGSARKPTSPVWMLEQPFLAGLGFLDPQTRHLCTSDEIPVPGVPGYSQSRPGGAFNAAGMAGDRKLRNSIKRKKRTGWAGALLKAYCCG
jgi:hypothetical protein